MLDCLLTTEVEGIIPFRIPGIGVLVVEDERCFFFFDLKVSQGIASGVQLSQVYVLGSIGRFSRHVVSRRNRRSWPEQPISFDQVL